MLFVNKDYGDGTYLVLDTTDEKFEERHSLEELQDMVARGTLIKGINKKHKRVLIYPTAQDCINSELKRFQFLRNPNSDLKFSEDCRTVTAYVGFEAEIEIPEFVQHIEDCAFSNASCEDTLKTVIFHDGIKTVGANAFTGCRALEQIILPKTVESIGNSAFENCENLKKVEFKSEKTKLGYQLFSFCSNLKSVKLPSKLEEIDTATFAYCKSLESIELPDTLKNLDDFAFQGCEKLKDIKLSSNLHSIGDEAFEDCACLTEIDLPASVLSVGCSAFDGCDIKRLLIHNPNVSFVDGAFDARNQPEVIYVTEDGTYSYPSLDEFYKELTADLPYNTSDGWGVIDSLKPDADIPDVWEIPNSVHTIEDKAFFNSNKLGIVKLPSTIGCLGSFAFAGSSVREVIFDGCNGIYLSEGVFTDCKNLKHITLPEGRGTLYNIFEGSGLETIDLPNGLVEIADYAFKHCCNLKTLRIPDSVRRIGECVFLDCVSLRELEIPKNLDISKSGVPSLCKVIVRE